MANLTQEEIKHVANLAHLELNKEEVSKYQRQLSQVVNYISELAKIETSQVEPTSQTTGLLNVFRTDEINIEKSLKIEEALSGSEKIHNFSFKVPAILDKDK